MTPGSKRAGRVFQQRYTVRDRSLELVPRGGTAEKVADGRTGLHFRAGGPLALATALRRAVTDPAVWPRLRSRLAAPHSMADHLTNLLGLYARPVGPAD